MRYRLLGRSGLRVSELCLGTMTFGEDWGWGANLEDSRAMFDTFAEAGGNFIDTANRYTEGTSERFVGEFIASDRSHFVLATKYTLYDRKDDPNASGNHRKNLVRSLDESLKRLQTDYIDLYWVHIWDFTVPVEEVMRALDDQVRAGKILHVGISDTPAWIISQANTIAAHRGWSSFVALQVPYSIARRDVERDLIPMASAFDMAVTPWGVLGGGVLTGKYDSGKEPTRYKLEEVDKKQLELAKTVRAVAEEAGRTPAQIALAWVRQKEMGTPMIPILGTRTLAQLQDNLACLDLELSADQIARLEAASPLDIGFPHDFYASEMVQDVTFGDHPQVIEDSPYGPFRHR